MGLSRARPRPLVSVVIPAFNAEKTLGACLESLRAQTLRDFEALVVDDASSDGTRSVARSTGDPRVRLIASPHNAGSAAARNRGLAQCRGRYVALQDADDLALPQRLALQVAFLEAGSADVVGSWAQWHGDVEGVIEQVPQGHDAIMAGMAFACCMVNTSVTFRASLLKLAPRPFKAGYRTGPDYELYSRWLRQGVRFANLPQPLACYRVHATQVSRARRSEQERHWDEVRAAWLRALGMQPSLEDVRRHGDIGQARWPSSPGELEAWGQWLQRLVEANERSGLVEPVAFYDAAALHWRSALLACSHLGLRPLRAWLGRPLKRRSWARDAKTLMMLAFCLEGALGPGLLAAWYRRRRMNPMDRLAREPGF